ncbi:hypothetical protein [Flavivirga rizhaonensis]|uniref:Uncharacterized protein n=1 Tax=Flavivirga rizhaonensis TaxID=2559571 RepID=A0A4S1DX11_9FLAO|nr:hypothetical protein [Flavivirga rizhaonensis]TGV02761.1 hypothetical protein EM932_10040 [Flavivirga rizhaonensis]
MESKIILSRQNTKEELYELFLNGTPLSGTEIIYIEPSKEKIYHKPFGNVLATNKYFVLQNQDFNGEPFLRSKFEYMQVLLPEYRLNSMHRFYPVLKGILNGYRICTKADKDFLTALANQIYYYYAPIQHVYRQTQERMDSFQKIEDIIDKVIATPFAFNGRKKYETIFWNPDYKLSSQEKTDLFNKYRGKELLNKNFETLINAYVYGMTQKELVKKTGISLSTIKRRWKFILQNGNPKQELFAAA